MASRGWRLGVATASPAQERCPQPLELIGLLCEGCECVCACTCVCVHMPVLGCQPDVLVQSVSPFSSGVSQQTQQAWLSTEPRNCWEQRNWPRDAELSRCMFQRLGRFRCLSRHLWSSRLLSCPRPPPPPPHPRSLRQPCGSWGRRSPAIPSPAVGVGAAGPSVPSPGVHTPARLRHAPRDSLQQRGWLLGDLSAASAGASLGRMVSDEHCR